MTIWNPTALQGEALEKLSRDLFQVAHQENSTLSTSDGTDDGIKANPTFTTNLVSILGFMAGIANKSYSKGWSLTMDQLRIGISSYILEHFPSDSARFDAPLKRALEIAANIYAELAPPKRFEDQIGDGGKIELN